MTARGSMAEVQPIFPDERPRAPQPELAMVYLLAPKAPFAGSNNAPRSAVS
jgi:hypothetical protein